MFKATNLERDLKLMIDNIIDKINKLSTMV